MVSANAVVDKDAIEAAFSKAPGAEMPYIANSLVAKAKKLDKVETAMEVLRVGVTEVHPMVPLARLSPTTILQTVHLTGPQ